jgi:hypothetical protein
VASFDSNKYPAQTTDQVAMIRFDNHFNFQHATYYFDVRVVRTTPTIYPLVNNLRLTMR